MPLVRSPHAPEYTARGVAIGVFWGVTPFLGLQTLLMIGTWQLLKRIFRKDASLLQAFLWSCVNNPLTMVPMYYLFYLTGSWLAGSAAPFGSYEAFAALWSHGDEQATMLARVRLLAEQIGVALIVGCVPYAIIASSLSYRWSLGVVRGRRRRLTAGRAPAEHRA